MSQLVIGPGICDRCQDRETCTHHQGRTITQCYDFRPNGTPSTASPTREFHSSSSMSVGANVIQNDPERLKGLCPTCSHYPQCSLMKPNGGVWHCEHYM